MWGIVPLYFRLFRQLPPAEVLAHRVLWSFLLLSGLLVVLRRWPAALRVLRSRGLLLRLTLSTLLIAVNWFTYIYAVSQERVIEASLGYFITPLVNVLLGVVFLRERLRGLQVVSLVLAAIGVLNLACLGRVFPVLALILATSFAFYGLMRKITPVDSMLGLFVETLLLAPVALLFLSILGVRDEAASLQAGSTTLGLLMVSGVVTTTPLLCFAAAARRLRMATLGILQYLSPTFQFVLAVVAFHEPFSSTQLASFVCIWSAVGLYCVDSYLAFRRPVAVALVPAAPIAQLGDRTG